MDVERISEKIININLSEEMRPNERQRLIDWAMPVAERIVEEMPKERIDRYLSDLIEMMHNIDEYVSNRGKMEKADQIELILPVFLSGAKIPVFDTEVPHDILKGIIETSNPRSLDKILSFYALKTPED